VLGTELIRDLAKDRPEILRRDCCPHPPKFEERGFMEDFDAIKNGLILVVVLI
jgi:hypothetical protein